jgi:hypothetical protein
VHLETHPLPFVGTPGRKPKPRIAKLIVTYNKIFCMSRMA